MENYYIYILRSNKDNKNYTGYTNNLDRRLQEHKEKRVKSTRNRGILELIYTETYKNKKEAQKRERFLKTRQGRRELRKILKN